MKSLTSYVNESLTEDKKSLHSADELKAHMDDKAKKAKVDKAIDASIKKHRFNPMQLDNYAMTVIGNDLDLGIGSAATSVLKYISMDTNTPFASINEELSDQERLNRLEIDYKNAKKDGASSKELEQMHERIIKLKKSVNEGKDTNDEPCWDDYEMVGTKMKDGREVPNCVPKNEGKDEGISAEDLKLGLTYLVKKGKIEAYAEYVGSKGTTHEFNNSGEIYKISNSELSSSVFNESLNEAKDWGTIEISSENDLIKLINKIAKKSKPFLQKLDKTMAELGRAAGQAVRGESMEEVCESSEFKIGDKIKLNDNGKIREYKVSKPGMRSSNDRLADDEVYLTAPGVMGFDAKISWVKQNMINEMFSTKDAEKLVLNAQTINEAEINSKEEFQSYAETVLKQAHGDAYDQSIVDQLVNDLAAEVGDDWGQAVGRLTSSLGESLQKPKSALAQFVNEQLQINEEKSSYWIQYQESAEKEKSVDDAIRDGLILWNDIADDPINLNKDKRLIDNIKKEATKFYKEQGWITTDIVQAMIAQL